MKHFNDATYSFPGVGQIKLADGPALLQFMHGLTTEDINELSIASQAEQNIRDKVLRWEEPTFSEISSLAQRYTKAGVYVTVNTPDTNHGEVTGHRLAASYVDELKKERGVAPEGPPGFRPGRTR
jgi:hypothetical protein